VGINDSPYVVKPIVNGIKTICPYYSRWFLMINRCYNPRYQADKPSYKGVSVCNDWLTFTSFKEWMEKQDWENKELDKDLLFPGNKVYSPNTCVFITRDLNALLAIGGTKSNLPRGMTKRTNKYLVRCGNEYIGYYDTVEEATIVYKKHKKKRLVKIANEQSDIRIKEGLIRHAINV